MWLEWLVLILPFVAQEESNQARLRRALQRGENVIGRGWSRGQSDYSFLVGFVLVLLLFAGLAVLVWRLVHWYRTRYVTPNALFYELADKHGLGASQRRLLLGVAKSYGLDDTAAIFVRRSLLEEYIEKTVLRETARDPQRERALREIVARIF